MLAEGAQTLEELVRMHPDELAIAFLNLGVAYQAHSRRSRRARATGTRTILPAACACAIYGVITTSVVVVTDVLFPVPPATNARSRAISTAKSCVRAIESAGPAAQRLLPGS